MAAEYFALCTLIGFAIAIVLIIRKVAPACCLIHAGAAVLCFLPNGSFFHGSGGRFGIGISKRMKRIPYEEISISSARI